MLTWIGSGVKKTVSHEGTKQEGEVSKLTEGGSASVEWAKPLSYPGT